MISWNALWPHWVNPMIKVEDDRSRTETQSIKCPSGLRWVDRAETGHYDVIQALGDLDLTRKETIKVRSHNQHTSLPDVFAGGDTVTGPATVVEAIGALGKGPHLRYTLF